MSPQDPELAQLLNRFVPVRITNFKGVDMNRFRFDYDLTFAVLLMDTDGRTYSRFGTQDWKHSSDRMSIPGLKQAMKDVLAVREKAGPAAPGPLPPTQPFTVADYPAWRARKAAGQACYHCHYANNARIAQLRLDGKFTKAALFRYPHPENVGITLEVDRNNVVRVVLPGSPAEKAGVRAGDTIARAEETPVFTGADLQFALDPLPDPGAVTLRLRRDGKELPPVKLALPSGWRKTDISWRPSQAELPPTVGIWAEPLSAAQRKQRGLADDRLALRVSFMFSGPKWAATRGDLKMNDILIGLNGQELPHMTTRQFHSHFRLNFNVGDTVTLNVLRGAQRLDIKVPCLEVGEE